LPAASLFADFAALCREGTLEFYRQELGVDVDARILVRIDDALGEE
jgi:hypothetical protein